MSDGFKVKKKPTIKEITSSVLELNSRINSLMGLLSELEKAFSLYIEMKNDNENFTKFIDEKVKQYEKSQSDPKPNEAVTGQNIPADSNDEGSGTERVRKKGK